MTEDNTTEANQAEGENQSDENNALIKDLRKQIKDQAAQLKAQPNASDLEEKIRAKVKRESSIEQHLVAFNVPKSVRELVEGTLGDAEITAEAVAEALTAKGFEVTNSTEGEAGSDSAKSLAAVTNLGDQVANASKADPLRSLSEKIANAKTPEELESVMAEAELT